MTDSLPYSMSFDDVVRWVATLNVEDFANQNCRPGYEAASAAERAVLEAIVDGRLTSFGRLHSKASAPIPATHWLSHRVISVGDEPVFASIDDAVALMRKVDGSGPADAAMLERHGTEVWRDVVFRRPDVLSIFASKRRSPEPRAIGRPDDELIAETMADAVRQNGGPNQGVVVKALVAIGLKREAARAVYADKYGRKRGPKGPRQPARQSPSSAS